ncbi:MAG: hypothetical protein ACM359_10815 [Bacillota bacterium]
MSDDLSNDITKVDLPEYVLVFAQGEPPPGEHRFSAISDEHAIGLAQRLYAGSKWVLYRLDMERRKRVYAYPLRHPGEQPAERPERSPERHGPAAV